MKTVRKHQSVKRSADILKSSNFFESFQRSSACPSDKIGIKKKIRMEH
jgi:hypothetical protein